MSAFTPLLGEKQTPARELRRSVYEYTAERERDDDSKKGHHAPDEPAEHELKTRSRRPRAEAAQAFGAAMNVRL